MKLLPEDDSHADNTSAPRLDHDFRHGESDVLVVVFSQVRVPAGKFGLHRLFLGTRHHCLFLNDTANHWYLGYDEKIDALIDAGIEACCPKRIIYYGSSMGGYGALTTYLRRGDGLLHAFGVEMELGRPGSQSADYLSSEALTHEPSLADLISKTGLPAHTAELYFGCLDPVDALQVQKAGDLLPNARLHRLTSSHGNHDHLYSLNIIRRIIKTFDRDPADELASKGLLRADDTATLTAFGLLQERFQQGSPVSASEVQALQGFDTHPGMMLLAARILARDGQHEAALAQLVHAEGLIAADPVLKTLPKRWRKTFPMERCRWALETGKHDLARVILSEAAEQFPIDEQMQELAHTLGISLAE